MARQLPTKNPVSVVPKLALRNAQTQTSKAFSAQKNLTNTVNTTATCTARSTFGDCCLKPEWFFSCPAHIYQAICLANASDGAWVGYSVSYDIASAECKNIQASLANGQYTEFSASFDQNAFR